VCARDRARVHAQESGRITGENARRKKESFLSARAKKISTRRNKENARRNKENSLYLSSHSLLPTEEGDPGVRVLYE